MARKKRKYVRRIIMINKPLQARLIFAMSLFPTLGLAATTVLVSYFSHRLYEEASLADMELESLVPMFLSVLGFVLVSGVFMVHSALMISHRIAGPQYRLCRVLEQIRRGDVAFRVRLRDGDHLHDLADEINLLLERLNENPAPGMRTFAQIEAERLERSGEAGEPTDDEPEPEAEPAGAARPIQAEEDEIVEAHDDDGAFADADESIPVANAKSLIDRQSRDRKVTIAAAGLTAVAGALLGIPWDEPSIPDPLPLPAAPQPTGNPSTRARVELGRLMFFDPLLSKDQETACATCHDPAAGFADPRGASIGQNGDELERNAPTVVNSGFSRALHWDGRVGSLEEQALETLLDPKQMGSTADEVLAKLTAVDEYGELFDRAFPETGITLTNLTRAIASYERTLVGRQTPYDRWAMGRDTLSRPAYRGYIVFHGRGGCAECHPGPLFGSDGLVAIGTPARDEGGPLVTDTDPGLERFTRRPTDLGAFRAVSLREVARTAPYMHNGVFGTLEEVVQFYDQGGGRGLGFDIKNQTELVKPLGLTENEKRDLLAFLATLSQEGPLDSAPEKVPSGLTPGGKH